MATESNGRRSTRSWLASPTALLALTTLLAALLRLVRLGSKPLWSAEVDEILKVRCDDSLAGVVGGGSDLLSPAWNQLVLRFGLEPLEWWARVPSALFGILAVPVAWLWGKRFAGKGGAGVAAILAATSVFLVDLSQSALPFMLVAVAGSAATLFLLDLVEPGADDASHRVRWGMLLAFWACDWLALLGHASGLVFPLAQAALLLVLRFRALPARPLAELARDTLLLLPLAPAAALQLSGALNPSAHPVLHHDVLFDVGLLGVGPLLQGTVIALSGAWWPFWWAYLLLLVIGGFVLARRNRTGALVVGVCVAAPMALALAMPALSADRSIDATFLPSLLFAPACTLAAAGIVGLLGLVRRNPYYGLLLAAGVAGFFLFTNARLLARYFPRPVKPVPGIDLAMPAKALESLEPTQHDLLVMPIDGRLLQWVFQAERPLKRVQRVGVDMHGLTAQQQADYLHLLDSLDKLVPDSPADPGASSRIPTRLLSSLEADSAVATGRLFVVLTCPPSYPLPFGSPDVPTFLSVPGYAAWVLSAGAVQDRCLELSSQLGGYEVYVFPGAILAFKDVAGRTLADLYRELSRVFRRVAPPTDGTSAG